LDVQSEEGRELFSKIQILRVRATFAGGAMDMSQQRRRWTDEEVTKLMSMAQKYPSAKSLPKLAEERIPSA
jgi:hypothetical protein